jgi:hypothetical protein
MLIIIDILRLMLSFYASSTSQTFARILTIMPASMMHAIEAGIILVLLELLNLLLFCNIYLLYFIYIFQYTLF